MKRRNFTEFTNLWNNLAIGIRLAAHTVGLFSRLLMVGDCPLSSIIHFVAGICVFFGGVDLITTFFTEESDGSKLTARTVRAVGFLILAGLLNGY